MTERITDGLVQFVESSGTEVAVTLVVQGTPIVGLLTSVLRHAEFMRQRFALWELAGNGPLEAETQPMSDAERERVRRSWADEHGELSGAHHTFDRLCLRDAVVRSGTESSWSTCPYLLVDADAVSAIALGYSVMDAQCVTPPN